MFDNTSLALIGVGVWGKNYIKTIENIDGITLKKIVCKNINKNKYLESKYDITDNLSEVTESSDIDGIIISSPPKTHFKIALEAIKNKKPLIVEKPFTLSSKEAQLLLDFALEKKVNIRVDHIYLYHPSYRFLKEYISGKKHLKSISSDAGNYGPFRNDISPLWDWGPHDLSMCLDLLGEMPLKVNAKITKKDLNLIKNNSNINVNLTFKDNKYAELNFGNLMKNKKRFFKVNFENESYIFDPLKSNHIQELRQNKLNKIKKNIISESLCIGKSPLEILLNEFVEDIKNSKFQIRDLKIAKSVVTILEKIESILEKDPNNQIVEKS